MRTLQKFSSLVLLLSLLISPSLPVSRAADNPISNAANYLKTSPPTPWTTMALIAAGETDVSTEHLKNIDTSSAITLEAPILAIAAAGHDPRSFAQEDLIAKLKTYHTAGQIGDPLLLNDDIFGILALSAAGEPVSDAAIQDAKTAILSAQKDNGSWGDTNLTAAAILALVEAGVTPSDAPVTRALNWLKGAQNEDGGFPYAWPVNTYTGAPDPSDSSSSSWVVYAIRKAGEDPHSAAWEKNGNNVSDALLALQQNNGSIAHSSAFTDETSFTPVSTAYTVIALSGNTLPVARFTPSNNEAGEEDNKPTDETLDETISFRIEGKQNTVCAGTLPLAEVSTALEVIPHAADQCGFTYEIVNASFGPYLKAIRTDRAQGVTGWLYRVNWSLPEVGAADYALQSQDKVLWYYGDFAWTPLRLTVDAAQVNSAQTVKVTVQQFSNNEWSPVNATIYGGPEPIQTDAQGSAAISLSDGMWTLRAEAFNTVRSNRVHVTVGGGNGQSVDLTVKVIPSSGDGRGDGTQGGTLSFIIAPSTLSFGNIAAGSSDTRTLTIRNTGSVLSLFTSAVHGDALFVDELLLDNASWRNFNASLSAGSTREVQATLTVPSDSAPGVQQGTLVFWAHAQ